MLRRRGIRTTGPPPGARSRRGDHYGRLLAYVERLSDGLVVNLSLVENGFAATLHIDPNDGMRHELAAAEALARSAGLGLWSACGGPHEPLAG